jgi:hypothetical protein
VPTTTESDSAKGEFEQPGLGQRGKDVGGNRHVSRLRGAISDETHRAGATRSEASPPRPGDAYGNLAGQSEPARAAVKWGAKRLTGHLYNGYAPKDWVFQIIPKFMHIAGNRRVPKTRVINHCYDTYWHTQYIQGLRDNLSLWWPSQNVRNVHKQA